MLYRQARDKRIQNHLTSFTNVKRTSLGRKHREGKDLPIENKPKAIKKIGIGSYILIITLNVNGLNAQPKDIDLLRWIQKQDPYICHPEEPTSDLGTSTD